MYTSKTGKQGRVHNSTEKTATACYQSWSRNTLPVPWENNAAPIPANTPIAGICASHTQAGYAQRRLGRGAAILESPGTRSKQAQIEVVGLHLGNVAPHSPGCINAH